MRGRALDTLQLTAQSVTSRPVYARGNAWQSARYSATAAAARPGPGRRPVAMRSRALDTLQERHPFRIWGVLGGLQCVAERQILCNTWAMRNGSSAGTARLQCVAERQILCNMPKPLGPRVTFVSCNAWQSARYSATRCRVRASRTRPGLQCVAERSILCNVWPAWLRTRLQCVAER
jgi:hypothetical protein